MCGASERRRGIGGNTEGFQLFASWASPTRRAVVAWMRRTGGTGTAAGATLMASQPLMRATGKRMAATLSATTGSSVNQKAAAHRVGGGGGPSA